MRSQRRKLTNTLSTNYECLAVYVLTSHGQVSYQNSTNTSNNSDDEKVITPAQIVNLLNEATSLRDKPRLLVLANLRSAETLIEQPPFWPFLMQESTRNAIIFQSYGLAHESIVVPRQGSGLI